MNTEGISTQITLVDRMTAPLRNITEAVNNMVDRFSSVSSTIDSTMSSANQSVNSGIDVAPIMRASSGLEEMASNIQDVASKTVVLNNAIQDVSKNKMSVDTSELTKSVTKTNSIVDKLKGTVLRFKTEFKKGFDPAPVDDFVMALQELGSQAKEKTNFINRLGSTMKKIKDSNPFPLNPNDNFNNSIKKSNSLIDGLWGKIKGVALAWASFEGAKKVISVSDDLTQTVARLNMIVKDEKELLEIQDKIFKSAERSRGSYMATANAVAKLSQNAGDVFSNNNETIQFAENLNKLFTIAGASTMEMESATLQLTQALGAGALRGEELNAVFEASPNIIRTIAEHMDVPIGKIREMASEGQITADIVKNAMLGATEEINKQFDNMPLTFGQIWQSFKNNVIMAFTPVFEKLQAIANSEGMQIFLTNAINGMYTLSNIVCQSFDMISALAVLIYDNWGIIEPAIWAVIAALGIYNGLVVASNTVEAISKGLKIASMLASYMKAAATGAEVTATTAATAAQYGFNTALLACPLTWVIVAVIAVIAIFNGLIAVINKCAGTTISATGIIMGAIFTAGAFIGNILIGILEIAFGVINELVNGFVNFANFLANIFVNPISTIINLFHNMADSVLNILKTIARAIDAVFGSNLAGVVSGWRGNLRGMTDKLIKKLAPDENYKEVFEKIDLNVKDVLGLDRFNYGDSYSKGYDFGKDMFNFGAGSGLDDYSPDDFSPDDYKPEEYKPEEVTPYSGDSGTLNDIAGNTGAMADSMEMSNEDLSYLRDMAERENINQFTTAEVHNHFGGITNNVASDVDLDGVVDYLAREVNNSMEVIANGSYT